MRRRVSDMPCPSGSTRCDFRNGATNAIMATCDGPLNELREEIRLDVIKFYCQQPNNTEIDTKLRELWSDGKGGIKPQYSFIANNWRKYLFNVEQEGIF